MWRKVFSCGAVLGSRLQLPLASHAVQEKNIKHSGSVTMSDIIEIARVMRPRSCAKDLANGCKEILGTAVSVGCKVDGKDPRDVIAAVGLRRVCRDLTGRGDGGHLEDMPSQVCMIR